MSARRQDPGKHKRESEIIQAVAGRGQPVVPIMAIKSIALMNTVCVCVRACVLNPTIPIPRNQGASRSHCLLLCIATRVESRFSFSLAFRPHDRGNDRVLWQEEQCKNA